MQGGSLSPRWRALCLLSAALCPLSVGFSPLSAQEGAPPGIPTAQEQTDDPETAQNEAFAEEAGPVGEPAADATSPNPQDDITVVEPGSQITFEADVLQYDNTANTVTAAGSVVLRNDNRSLRADRVIWDRNTGEIQAEGGIRLVDAYGNELVSDSLTLTDEFEAGAMRELLLRLAEGGRLAAREGLRGPDGSIVLQNAAYTACNIIEEDGCDTSPSWRITAERVVYDPNDSRVRFTGAYLELFGARILPLPGLAIRTNGSAASGFALPNVRVSNTNGVELSGSYYWRLAENRDLTAGLTVFTEAPPLVTGQWRHLTETGAYQITGYATESRRIRNFTGEPDTARGLRGYLFANGRFQLSPEWSVKGSARVASDRTFLRRYDISREDRLRSFAELERIDENSYLSIAGWATQTLRLERDQGQVPIALPVIDYRRILPDPVLDGRVMLQFNTLSIARDVGQDTQRAFALAKWDLRRLTPFGQVVTLTALGRADVYHTDETGLTETAIYRGEEGWNSRAVGLAALDVEWPLVGRAFGGEQVLTPRVQLVATPPIRNLAVPNEDARAIDLEDSNLFALSRFPGYDRVEDGVRLTYGLDWKLQRPGWIARANIGQSYRFDKDSDILLDGTGLSERVSDIVGRTELTYRNYLRFTHRYRLDKDNLALRRNEIDATIGSRNTYVEVGYLKLDRNIDADIEDLQDREELRFAARALFARYWSVFGSGVINLTNAAEDSRFGSDGFEPIRTRLGFAYEDDCLELGLTWRRDFVTAGDAQRGNTFQLYFSLKNLGFR